MTDIIIIDYFIVVSTPLEVLRLTSTIHTTLALTGNLTNGALALDSNIHKSLSLDSLIELE